MDPNNPRGPPLINSSTSFFRFNSEIQRWDSLPESPRSRSLVSSVSLGSFIFFAGGFDEDNIVPGVDIWDETSSTWSTENRVFNRYGMATTSVSTKYVLFAGGFDSQNNPSVAIDLFDLTSSLWHTARLSEARGQIAAAGNDRYAFFGGGALDQSNSAFSRIIDVWDSQTGLFSTLSLITGRTALAATCVGSFVLFAGGYGPGTGRITVVEAQNIVDIYNLEDGTQKISSLSQARYFMTAASIGPFAIFAGGTDNALQVFIDNTAFSDVDIWNSRDGSWIRLSLVFPQYSPFIFPFSDTNIVLIGNGVFNEGRQLYINVFDMFTYSKNKSVFSFLIYKKHKSFSF